MEQLAPMRQLRMTMEPVSRLLAPTSLPSSTTVPVNTQFSPIRTLNKKQLVRLSFYKLDIVEREKADTYEHTVGTVPVQLAF